MSEPITEQGRALIEAGGKATKGPWENEYGELKDANGGDLIKPGYEGETPEFYDDGDSAFSALARNTAPAIAQAYLDLHKKHLDGIARIEAVIEKCNTEKESMDSGRNKLRKRTLEESLRLLKGDAG